MSPLRKSILRNAAGGSPTPPGETVGDIGGWTAVTPALVNTTTYTRAHLSQPGARIMYVDPSITKPASIALDVAGGDYYFWNGAAIVDSAGSTTGAGGVPYGTDWLNPTGPVKPYYHVGVCLKQINGKNRCVDGQLSSGTNTGAGTYGCTAGAGRNGRGDIVLLKRGTTLLLETDLHEVGLEGTPGLTKANLQGSLVGSGGGSAADIEYFGAYGPLTAALPVITEAPALGFMRKFGTGSGNSPTQWMMWRDLYFDGYTRSYVDDRPAATFMYQIGTAGVAANYGFEGCVFAGTGGLTIQLNTNLGTRIYGCAIVDSWGATRPQGIFQGDIGLSHLDIVGTFLGRNGSSTSPIVSFTPDALCRNIYQSGESAGTALIDNCLFAPGSSGEQFRAGATLQRTYFMGSGVYLCGQNGAPYATSQAYSGKVSQIVVERMYQAVVGSAPGIGLGFGPQNVEMSDYVITDAGMSPSDRTAYPAGAGLGGYSTGYYHTQLAPTQGCRIHGGVVVNRAGVKSWTVNEGVISGGLTNFVVTGVGTARWNMLDNHNDYISGPINSTLTGAATTGTTVLATGTAVGANLRTENPLNISVVHTDGSTKWYAVTAVNAGTGAVTIAAPGILAPGAASGAATQIWPASIYTYRGTTGNQIDTNIVIGQSDTNANASTYNTDNVAGATATDDTAISGNTHLTTAAAATAGYDLSRCMLTYMQSIGYSISPTATQAQQRDALVATAKTWKRGYWDPNWQGKKVVNHVRAGMLMSALS